MTLKQVSAGSAAKRGSQQPAAPALAAIDEASLFLLQKQYQDLASQHLGDLRQALFAELTGLHFHIVWTPLRPCLETSLPSPCSVCCQLVDSDPLPHCGVCGLHHLEMTRRAERRGHRFTCEHGVGNYWFSITVRDLVIGTAFVQALDKASHFLRKHAGKKPAKADAQYLDRAEFDHAAHLLRFIAQSAETAALAELNQLDAKEVRHAMDSLRQEQDRLHEHIQRLLPEEHQLPASPHHPPPPLVKRMLEYVHRQYAEPITLQECARAHGHNAAYLSNLFSKVVGLPFKRYLTELRLEKSKQLLDDPDRNINEIAEAVGYASANRFRLAFKQQTGLSPRAWRVTMRPAPQPIPVRTTALTEIQRNVG